MFWGSEFLARSLGRWSVLFPYCLADFCGLACGLVLVFTLMLVWVDMLLLVRWCINLLIVLSGFCDCRCLLLGLSDLCTIHF